MKTKNFTNILDIFIMILGFYLAFSYIGVSTPPVLSGLAFIFIATSSLLKTNAEEYTIKRRK